MTMSVQQHTYTEAMCILPTPNTLPKAIADYTKAIALDANNDLKAFAHKFRGIVYALNKPLDQAIADYTQAITLFSNNDEKASVYELRGKLYRDEKQYPKAEYDYTQAIAL